MYEWFYQDELLPLAISRTANVGLEISEAFNINDEVLRSLQTMKDILNNKHAVELLKNHKDAYKHLSAALAPALDVGEKVYMYHKTFGTIEFVVAAKNEDHNLDINQNTTTLISTNIITHRPWNDHKVPYHESNIKQWLNGEFLYGLVTPYPIVPVYKNTNTYDHDDRYILTLESCWLLSREEIENVTYNIGGKIKFASDDVTVGKWWLRSPYTGLGDYAYYVNVDGTIKNGNYSGYYVPHANGVVVGLVI